MATKLINGVRVTLTAEEEASFEAEREVHRNKLGTYKEKRQRQYPSVADQLDMIWHAIDAGVDLKSSEFYTSLKTVKDNNPKPDNDA